MIEIDGSQGEGGGQILRSALSLSLLTGKPFRIARIRAGREKPGLLRQHLTAVNAAAEIGSAKVSGAEMGSQLLSFEPGPVRPGDYRFAIGSAGSTMLVLQTVLLPLALAPGVSRVVIEGGTHNPWAPPVDFLQRAFLPLASRMGIRARVELEKHGFFPAGGGRIAAELGPGGPLEPLDLPERGPILRREARALVSDLSPDIGLRELAKVRSRLDFAEADCRIEQLKRGAGPGNVLTLSFDCEHATEVFTGFGERGRTAEQVAEGAVKEARHWLASGAPVGPHLADQLLLPMAVAGGGSFRTVEPTEHTRTNLRIVALFLDIASEVRDIGAGAWQVTLRA